MSANISGMFPQCLGYYDEASGKYIKNSGTEMYECCLNSIEEVNKFCNNYCEQFNTDKYKYQACKRACVWHHNLITDYCSLTTPLEQIDNIFATCTYESGCGNSYMDSNCITKNKDAIKTCCLKTCNENLNIDCENYCNYNLDLYTTVKLGYNFIDESGGLDDSNYKDNIEDDLRSNNIIGILLGCILALIVIGVLYQIQN